MLSRICQERDAESAMRRALATLRFIFVAVDVTAPSVGNRRYSLAGHFRSHSGNSSSREQRARLARRTDSSRAPAGASQIAAMLGDADNGAVAAAVGGRAVVGGACSDDASWDEGYGGCGSYAPGQENEGYCVEDVACDSCLCSCAQECVGGGAGAGQGSGGGAGGVAGGAAECVDDELFDGGFGNCST